MKRVFPFLFLPLALASCVDAGLKTDPASITTDVAAVEVIAEFVKNQPDSIKTVTISSNTSWYAHLNDADNPIDPSDPEQKVPWGHLSCSAHQNLTGNVQSKSIDIIFTRNKSDKPVNGRLDIYADGHIVKSVQITQQGAIYHLDASVKDNRTQVTSVADTVLIDIDCNTEWHVAVDKSSSASVSLSAESGFDPGSVKVMFDDNLSQTETKHARVIVSAANCEDKVFEFEQALSQTYLILVSNADVKHDYGQVGGSIIFRTNTKWTIEQQENTMHNFQLSSYGGDGSESPYFSLDYSFDEADDPAVVDAVKLILSAGKAVDPIEINISQRGHLKVVFDGNKCFSPKLPTAAANLPDGYKGLLDYVEKSTNRVNFAFTTARENVYYFSSDFRLNCRDIYNDPAKSLVLNYLGNNDPIGKGVKGIPPYWKLPGIEGMVMTKIVYHLTPKSGDNIKNKFLGWLYTDDYCYGEYAVIENANRNTIPTYGVEVSATQLHQFKYTDYTEDKDVVFDLAALNILQPAGRGITVASNIGLKGANAPEGVPYPVPDNAVSTVMNALVKSIEIYYEPAK